jgi:hypothetical protein
MAAGLGSRRRPLNTAYAHHTNGFVVHDDGVGEPPGSIAGVRFKTPSLSRRRSVHCQPSLVPDTAVIAQNIYGHHRAKRVPPLSNPNVICVNVIRHVGGRDEMVLV